MWLYHRVMSLHCLPRPNCPKTWDHYGSPSRRSSCSPQSATRFGRQVSGRPHGLNPWLLHSQRKATSSCDRTTEHYCPFQGGASVVVHIYVCYRIYNVCLLHDVLATGDRNAVCIALCIVFCFVQASYLTTFNSCSSCFP